jgi:hypothetical protein
MVWQGGVLRAAGDHEVCPWRVVMTDVDLCGNGGGFCRGVQLMQGDKASRSAGVCGVIVVLLMVRVAETLR